MIDYHEALKLVLNESEPCAAEPVDTTVACGRVLAQDVDARISSPPFDKAAMDGYAVRAEDVRDLPAELHVVGEAFAGRPPDATVGPGQAAVITTGAPVPDGADTVVMVEHTEKLPGGSVRVLKLSGRNICPEGEDIGAGDTVLRAGQQMTPLRVGVAAAAGHARLRLHRRPSGALLCTGTEVVEPGEEPATGQIYNANGPMLSALMRPVCRSLEYLGTVGDDREDLLQRLQRGLAADVMVITGGVSVGQYDLVPDALEEAGVRRIFHKVAIKPGKPTYFGRTDRTLVFGMPGNPQSCFVVFKMIVEPALAARSGVTAPGPRLEKGRSGEGFANKPARMNVMPCRIDQEDSYAVIRRHPYHGSADIVGPGEADGYFIVPRGTEHVREGQTLRFFRI